MRLELPAIPVAQPAVSKPSAPAAIIDFASAIYSPMLTAPPEPGGSSRVNTGNRAPRIPRRSYIPQATRPESVPVFTRACGRTLTMKIGNAGSIYDEATTGTSRYGNAATRPLLLRLASQQLDQLYLD